MRNNVEVEKRLGDIDVKINRYSEGHYVPSDIDDERWLLKLVRELRHEERRKNERREWDYDIRQPHTEVEAKKALFIPEEQRIANADRRGRRKGGFERRWNASDPSSAWPTQIPQGKNLTKRIGVADRRRAGPEGK